jgi:hypothetical protein
MPATLPGDRDRWVKITKSTAAAHRRRTLNQLQMSVNEKNEISASYVGAVFTSVKSFTFTYEVFTMTLADCITIPTTDQPSTDVAEPNCTPADPETEFILSNQVDQLWTRHAEVNSTKKASAAELRVLRQELSERLYNMKALLCSSGRNSRWRGWLRERAIPRSTADRLVSRYAELLGDSANVLGGNISSEETLERLLYDTLKRLSESLNDDWAKYRFLRSLIERLGLQVEDDDWGFAVLEPETVDGPEDQPPPDPYKVGHRDDQQYGTYVLNEDDEEPRLSDLPEPPQGICSESAAAASPPRKCEISL